MTGCRWFEVPAAIWNWLALAGIEDRRSAPTRPLFYPRFFIPTGILTEGKDPGRAEMLGTSFADYEDESASSSAQCLRVPDLTPGGCRGHLNRWDMPI